MLWRHNLCRLLCERKGLQRPRSHSQCNPIILAWVCGQHGHKNYLVKEHVLKSKHQCKCKYKYRYRYKYKRKHEHKWTRTNVNMNMDTSQIEWLWRMCSCVCLEGPPLTISTLQPQALQLYFNFMIWTQMPLGVAEHKSPIANAS